MSISPAPETQPSPRPQYAVYKGIHGKFGAAQFDLAPPTTQSKGAVFLSITSASAASIYDWEHKIIFALGVNDLASLCLYIDSAEIETKTSLVHDPGAGGPDKGKVLKTLTLSCPGGPERGFILTVSSKMGENSTKHTVPLAPHEAYILRELFRTAIPRLVSWTA